MKKVLFTLSIISLFACTKEEENEFPCSCGVITGCYEVTGAGDVFYAVNDCTGNEMESVCTECDWNDGCIYEEGETYCNYDLVQW